MQKLQTGLRRLLAAGGCVLAAGLPLASSAQDAVGADVTYLSQGWDRDGSRWYYHVSQGTVFMPAEWFLALQQASGTALFAAPDHLARLGFLPDATSEQNPFGLPVGFAVRPLDFPDNGQLQHFQIWKGRKWIGLTCAACHTGQVTFKGQRIRIDGGPAHLDLDRFGDELGAALVATAGSEPRFGAFAAKVRGLQANVSDDELHEELNVFLQDLGARNSLFEAGEMMASEKSTPPGRGRLDAVHKGGNFLLSASLGEVRNYVPTTAPVRYPMLWDTPYFDWVLYNASIRQPMARNVIEDLGVGAPVDPATLLKGPVNHALLMDNLVEVHRALKRLQSPQWPEAILGSIDRTLAERGGSIFAQLCAGCHQRIDRSTHDAYSADADGATIWVQIVPLEEIGTDPRQARNFADRMIDLGGPALVRISMPPSKWRAGSSSDGRPRLTTLGWSRRSTAAGKMSSGGLWPIVLARSMACGPRRRTCTTGRFPPCMTCCFRRRAAPGNST